MILLHGGFDAQFLYGVAAGFIAALVAFVYLFIAGIKSRFYKGDFKNLSIAQKAFISLIFTMLAFFVSVAAFYLFMVLTIVIVSHLK